MNKDQEKNSSQESKRIKIDDMPKLEDMTPEEQQGIVGGGGFPQPDKET